MPAIFTRGNKVSNFLKKEFWPEEFYCRANATITKASLVSTDSPGELVIQTAPGVFGALPATVNAVTDTIGVIVDSDWDLKLEASGGNATVENVAILVKGPCVLRKGGLVAADVTDIADAYTALERQGFTLADMFSVPIQTLPL